MSVPLLCHFDGASGSTVFNDTGGYHALTPTGVTVNTAAPKFGTGAGDFTSSSAARIDTGNSADFNLGAGPFTVEAWIYFPSSPSSGNQYAALSQSGGASNLGWELGLILGYLDFAYSTTGSDYNHIGYTTGSAAFTPSPSTWYHFAVDRDASNVVRVYLNGSVVASATVSSTIFASTQTCMIGNDHNNNRGFPGWLDEARITVGLAQYGGAFTPPTAPFPNVPQTTRVQATQVALEEWAAPSPQAQVTQASLEMWASVALAAPPPYVPPPPPAPSKGKGGGKGGKGAAPPLQFGAPALQGEVERFGEFRLKRRQRRPQVIFQLPAALILSESAVTAAALTATVAHAATLSVSAATSDAIQGGRILAALLAVGATASDALAAALTARAALAEASHATDASGATAHMTAQLAAAAAPSDLPHHGDAFPAMLSESASTSAVIAAFLATQAHLSEGAAANAVVAGFRTLVVGLAEGSLGSAALAAQAALRASLSEGAAAAGSLSALAAFIAAIAEETGAEDALAAVKRVHASLAEGASTLDADKWLATTRPFRRGISLQGERTAPDLEGRLSSPDLIGRRSSPDLEGEV